MRSANSLVTAVTLVEDRGPFICAAQLLRIETHSFPSTFHAALVYESVCLHVSFAEGLDFGSLCAQSRGEGCRL